MKTRCFFFTLLTLISNQIYAGAKEDFIAAVVSQCKLPEAEANALATPGRTGNVTAFKICLTSPQAISDECSLTCQSNSGNVVGN